MGNYNSLVYNDKCFNCKEHIIKEEMVECIKCNNIKLHEYCIKNINNDNCPKCLRKGTMKQDLYYKYKYQK